MTPKQIWTDAYSNARKVEKQNAELGLSFSYSIFINHRQVSLHEDGGHVTITLFNPYTAGFYRQWFFQTLANKPRNSEKRVSLRMMRISAQQQGFKLP